MTFLQPDYSIDTVEGIATLTFRSPKTRNALTRATRLAFVDDVRRLDGDPSVRAIILTGADPAFTSGVNAKELFGDPDYVAPPVDPPTALRELTTPVIAAVNGVCYSGGLEIALACSFIIASENATFADTHAKLGITPGWGLAAELPARIGIGRARQLALTGLPIDAATAYEWNLVNEVVAHDALAPRARELAEAITRLPPAAVTETIRLYRRIHETGVSRAREIEREVGLARAGSPDPAD